MTLRRELPDPKLVKGWKIMRDIYVNWLRVLALLTSIMSMQVSAAMEDMDDHDYLVPEIPYLLGIDDYTLIVRSLFADGFRDDVLLRTFVAPSFGPEYMFGIRKVGKEYFAFVLTSKVSVSGMISSDRMVGGYQANHAHKSQEVMAGKVDMSKIDNLQNKISAMLVKRIKSIWKKELLAIKYPASPPIIIDGTTYRFSMFIEKHGLVGGRLNSFSRGSKMDMLTQLVETLVGFSKGEMGEDAVRDKLRSIRSDK